MRVEIDIRTAGAAFCDDDGAPDEYRRAEEVARLMREVTEQVGNGHRGGTLRDFLGNRVGAYVVTEED